MTRRSQAGAAVVAAVAAVVVMAAAGRAEAQSADVAERWVGTWTGKATWKGCTTAGSKKLALTLVAARGTITLDGDTLMEGLGDVDFAAALAALSAPRDDLSLTLTWGKKGVKLAMKTAGGCTAKATLTRTSSGIAACDAALALREVDAGCGGTAAGDAAADRKAWKKLTGKKKKAQAARCEADAATLRADLGTRQCLTGGGAAGAARTGYVWCDQYIDDLERYLRCDKIPQETRDAARQGMDAMLEGWRQAGQVPDDVRVQVNDACKTATEALRQGANALGCPL